MQLLLVLASAVILRFVSRGTHDHILLSQIRDPQTGGPGPSIYILQEQGGPVIPQTLPFSSPPTPRRAAVEVYDRASTQVWR
jgi:hypothetical protein